MSRKRRNKWYGNLFPDWIEASGIALPVPRRARIATGKIVYHALNRAKGRNKLFQKPVDYSALERIMVAAVQRSPIRLLAYWLIPNHWRMVL